MLRVCVFLFTSSVETSRKQMKMRKEESKSRKEKIGFMVMVGKPEGRKENI